MTGQHQPSRVGRRLAAIVAADVVGYSRLMGLDEVGTARTLREHRKVTDALVEKHGGRLVKSTGDGVLLEFPSVVDAVECAVAVQEVMAQRNEGVPVDRRMIFRIGINLGDILIEGDDILGDGVNIAARLESIAEPGGICIAASAYDQVRGKVPVNFTDLGEQPLKNIAQPVHAYAVVPGAKLHQIGLQPAAAPHLSLVVLPFLNISGDPEQEYFVDGVTESLTTDLSRIAGAFVIARNTAFTFKGKSVDVKRLGRELNVRYVLEGSVQRSGNRLRVNVQLIDPEKGGHVWADRFESSVENLFEVQDEIVSRLANSVNAQLIDAEAQRAQRSAHPDATDCFFQGRALLNKLYSPEFLAKARVFFERTLSLDPSSIEAVIGCAAVDFHIATNFFADDRMGLLTEAEKALINILSVAPDHAEAHALLGSVYINSNRAAQGIPECERALALDRNLAWVHGMIGWAKFITGRGAEIEAHVQEALRLSPRDLQVHRWIFIVGTAKLWDGADYEAALWLRRSIEVNRNYPLAHFQLAVALAHLGQLDDARASVQAGLVHQPSFTLRRYRANLPSNHPTYLAGRERIYEGMRLAGVPEG